MQKRSRSPRTRAAEWGRGARLPPRTYTRPVVPPPCRGPTALALRAVSWPFLAWVPGREVVGGRVIRVFSNLFGAVGAKAASVAMNLTWHADSAGLTPHQAPKKPPHEQHSLPTWHGGGTTMRARMREGKQRQPMGSIYIGGTTSIFSYLGRVKPPFGTCTVELSGNVDPQSGSWEGKLSNARGRASRARCMNFFPKIYEIPRTAAARA